MCLLTKIYSGLAFPLILNTKSNLLLLFLEERTQRQLPYHLEKDKPPTSGDTPLWIITTLFSVMSSLTRWFLKLLNGVTLMSNSYFLSWSSHVVNGHPMEKQQLSLPTRVATILKALPHIICFKTKLLLIRKVCLLKIQTIISYPC